MGRCVCSADPALPCPEDIVYNCSKPNAAAYFFAKLGKPCKSMICSSLVQFDPFCYMQPPPLQLVHRVFGEFVSDAAGIQPSPDTFDFVLETCALLADFYPDESIRQQLFNRHLAQYLGKTIYRVSLTSGVSATDGSIVDNLEKPEVMSQI